MFRQDYSSTQIRNKKCPASNTDLWLDRSDSHGSRCRGQASQSVPSAPCRATPARGSCPQHGPGGVQCFEQTRKMPGVMMPRIGTRLRQGVSDRIAPSMNPGPCRLAPLQRCALRPESQVWRGEARCPPWPGAGDSARYPGIRAGLHRSR